tara:strand:+ start:1882 stop:2844 length:963 start_codon:yes stop_codon:yes gene_type:complete
MPTNLSQSTPEVHFDGLETLWVQITGTLCNLACTHCFISCAPDNHALEFMSREKILAYIDEAATLGVKEIYFTGGEPFLHPSAIEILDDALAVAPTVVLTNGVLITERTAARLSEIADASLYSLEIRVSLDAPDEQANDAIRGPGVFRKALRGVRRLERAGLMPIVTACELVVEQGPDDVAMITDRPMEGPLPVGVNPELLPPPPSDDQFYNRFQSLLHEEGIKRPRLKILPVFNMGMLEGRRADRLLTEDMLEEFDTGNLQCSSARLVAEDGVYACPILAGESGARLPGNTLAEANKSISLYHPSCTTCFETGMTCRNY